MNLIGSRWFVPLCLGLIAVMLIGVFRVKDESADAARAVRALEAEVAAARQERAVLKAETQYLQSPARLEALAGADPLTQNPLTDPPPKPVEPTGPTP
jgi:hypothetical protein